MRGRLRIREADKCQAGRFVVLRRRSGHAGDGNAQARSQEPADALRHGRRRLGADRAMRLQGPGRHAKLIELDLVAIGDQTSRASSSAIPSWSSIFWRTVPFAAGSIGPGLRILSESWRLTSLLCSTSSIAFILKSEGPCRLISFSLSSIVAPVSLKS